jgi:DNA-directed RNA polymerase specialized sigma24 family protein
MSIYVTSDELSRALSGHLAGDANATNDLYRYLYMIADGLLDRYTLTYQIRGDDRDDLRQEMCILAGSKADRYDPEKGTIFNFFSTCCLNHMRQKLRGRGRQQRLIQRMADHLGDNIPEV